MQQGSGNIVFELKMLDNLLKKNADAHFRELDTDDQLTRMHHWIIDFLYRNQEKDIYQRDIEAEFSISRSTTSNILSLMEKKKLINRLSVENDARLKKVVLTDKAVDMHIRLTDTARKLDAMAENALTEGEKSEFIRIINKLRGVIIAEMKEKNIKIDDDRR